MSNFKVKKKAKLFMVKVKINEAIECDNDKRIKILRGDKEVTKVRLTWDYQLRGDCRKTTPRPRHLHPGPSPSGSAPAAPHPGRCRRNQAAVPRHRREESAFF